MLELFYGVKPPTRPTHFMSVPHNRLWGKLVCFVFALLPAQAII
jgi:hypothetical protein